jgi:STE24 endopeptidase
VTKRRAASAALGVGLAAAWVLIAARLWRSQVPAGLHLQALDPHSYFTSAQLRQMGSFERFLRIDALLAALAQVATLVLYARHGERFTRESAAGRVGTGMLLGMLGFAFVWLAQLPFGIAGLWWERGHGVSHQGYVAWLFGNFFALGGVFVFVCAGLGIAMGLAGLLRRRWWVLGAPVFVALALLFTFVQPYLIAPTHPLRDPALVASARTLAREEGLRPVPVEVQDVHRFTTAPNAEAVGLGPSRRVIVWDTLLDGDFSHRQIRVVLAHELGHLSRNHLWKQLAWLALIAFPLMFLLERFTRRRGGLYEPTAVPLALLVLVLLQLVVVPLQNAISRRIETEADWVALRTTRDPAADIGLMRRLAVTSRTDPDPPGWAELLFEDHPSIMERIELARAAAPPSAPRPPPR